MGGDEPVAPVFFDDALLDRLTQQARRSERQRVHHLLHRSHAEPCQRLLMGLQPSTYVAPHRHLAPEKAEMLTLLRGRVGVVLFDGAGAVTACRSLGAADGCLGVDIPAGLYHALVTLEADSVLLECKAGPYLPLAEGEQAPWAPAEGEPRAATFLAELRALFD
ncbi:WbuC family cupin fold metalloprotein [Stutzerimonas urumqiensis]|uniref:WbuC family cupin fold metalloprotein n=1 Tax=Stutzerimonas urumqiensis TaxID=638269 RepID=UPI003DA3FDFA